MPLSVDLLKKYMAPVFIETGSWIGNGIKAALDAGFERVYSVDIEPGEHGHCVERFGADARVTLACEHSARFLARVLWEITEDATVFLDAHCVPRGTPLLWELDAVSANPQLVRYLLIDDLRIIRAGNDWAKGMDEAAIVRRVESIGFQIDWDTGPETGAERDILVGRRP